MVKFRDSDRKKVKALGKRDVEENRGGCILISFLCSGVPSIIGVGLYVMLTYQLRQALLSGQTFASFLTDNAVSILCFSVAFILILFGFLNVLQVGMNRYYLQNTEGDAEFSDLGFGFRNNYWKIFSAAWLVFLVSFLVSFIIGFVTALLPWEFIGSMLQAVVSFYLVYRYRFVLLILADNPNIKKASDALSLSARLTKGQLAALIKFDVSFFLWYLLSGITLGLASILYVTPYKTAANAELYLWLKERNVGVNL